MVIKPTMFVPTSCMIRIAGNVDFAGSYKREEDHLCCCCHESRLLTQWHTLTLTRLHESQRARISQAIPCAVRVHVGARSATVPYKTSHAQREGSWSFLLLLFPWYAVLRSLLSYAVPCHAGQRPKLLLTVAENKGFLRRRWPGHPWMFQVLDSFLRHRRLGAL